MRAPNATWLAVGLGVVTPVALGACGMFEKGNDGETNVSAEDGGSAGQDAGSAITHADPMCIPDELSGALTGTSTASDGSTLQAVFAPGGKLWSIDGVACTSSGPFYNTGKCLECNWSYQCGECSWRLFINGTTLFNGPWIWTVAPYMGQPTQCAAYYVDATNIGNRAYRLKAYVPPPTKPTCLSGVCLSNSDCPSGQTCGNPSRNCSGGGGGGGTVRCGGSGDTCATASCCGGRSGTLCCAPPFCSGDCVGSPCCG